jgi:hypothetical protein
MKTQAMKKILFLVLSLSPLLMQAQFHFWYPAVPVTDSAHFNRNAVLSGSYDQNLLFWEKETDVATTGLFYKDFTNATSGEQTALLTEGMHYTHPALLELQGNPPMPGLALIFQTSQNADIDLAYSFRNPDGSFSTPQLISGLPGDDLNPVGSSNNQLLAWENSGKIFVSTYLWPSQSFTAPFAVDSGGATNPVLNHGSLIYLKTLSGTTQIITRGLYYNQGSWTVSDPSVKPMAVPGSNLSATDGFMTRTLALQTENNNGLSGIALLTAMENDIFLASQLYNYTEPVVSSFDIAVKSSQFIGMYILAYVSDSLGQKEIIGNNALYTDSITNISAWPGKDEHPRFFETFPNMYTVRVNLFWESERQGFSTIYYSHYDYLFGGSPEKTKPSSLRATPAPFTDETRISTTATGVRSIQIFDLQGSLIRELRLQSDGDGVLHALWNGRDERGNTLPSGGYIVRAVGTGGSESTIVLKK